MTAQFQMDSQEQASVKSYSKYKTFHYIDVIMGASNHQPHDCLLNRLFGRRWKKTSKLRVTGRCAGNSPGPVNSPHKRPVTREMFPFDDVIMFNHENALKCLQNVGRIQTLVCQWCVYFYILFISLYIYMWLFNHYIRLFNSFIQTELHISCWCIYWAVAIFVMVKIPINGILSTKCLCCFIYCCEWLDFPWKEER